MKVIVVAAGEGNRLKPLTNDKPKCLLEIGGRAIMQKQLEVLKECGISNIAIVRGYKKEMINYPNIKYYENTNYKNNNILRSLFYADKEMDDEFVFSYSDIIFEKSVLERLLQSKADISLVIDVNWIGHYQYRYQHPVEEAEIVEVKNGKMISIGKRIIKPEEAHGEFIGLAKFTKEGAKILKSNHERVVREYNNKPFHQAASAERAYLTDMIQELIDVGYTICSVDIKAGWMEIDTPEDLEKARRCFA